MPTLLEAIDRVIEANVPLRKRRALAKPERQLEAAMAKAFRAQAREFLSRLAMFKGRFPPEVREALDISEWERLFDDASLNTLRAFADPIDEFTARALASGMLSAVAEIGVDMSFTLEHPAAVAYLRDHGAEQVTKINQTTRNGLRTILTQASDEGWSYNKTATAIRGHYADFSVTRARNIAVFELGDGYEFGNRLVAQDLQNTGLVMEKSWLSVGDANVRPDHQANEAEGWIPLDDVFQDGSDRPPTDPRCRCTLQMRRKPDD